MSHVTKIQLKIILYRNSAAIDREIGENQSGFRKGKGTREGTEQIGGHNTIILASFGTLLASTWIWFSPLPKLRDLPTIEDNG